MATFVISAKHDLAKAVGGNPPYHIYSCGSLAKSALEPATIYYYAPEDTTFSGTSRTSTLQCNALAMRRSMLKLWPL